MGVKFVGYLCLRLALVTANLRQLMLDWDDSWLNIAWIWRVILQIWLGTAHFYCLSLLIYQWMLWLRSHLGILKILQPALKLLWFHMLLKDFALLMEVVNSFQGLVINLSVWVIILQIALLNRIVHERMQLFFWHRILHLSLEYLPLFVRHILLRRNQTIVDFPKATQLTLWIANSLILVNVLLVIDVWVGLF